MYLSYQRCNYCHSFPITSLREIRILKYISRCAVSLPSRFDLVYTRCISAVQCHMHHSYIRRDWFCIHRSLRQGSTTPISCTCKRLLWVQNETGDLNLDLSSIEMTSHSSLCFDSSSDFLTAVVKIYNSDGSTLSLVACFSCSSTASTIWPSC